jgi:hypothetical protein
VAGPDGRFYCNGNCTLASAASACASPRVTTNYVFRSPGKYGLTVYGSTFEQAQVQVDVASTTAYVPAVGTWGLLALASVLTLAGLFTLAARRTRSKVA